MAEGKSNLGIAETLVVSEAAVEKHVTGIFHKLGIGRPPWSIAACSRCSPTCRTPVTDPSEPAVDPAAHPVPTWEGSRYAVAERIDPIGPTRASSRGEAGSHAEERAAGGELRRLADEQSALRRVAEIAARGAEPDAVFARVASEASALLGDEAITLVRFEGESELVVVAVSGGPAPLGRRIGFDAETLPTGSGDGPSRCAWTTTPSSAMPGWRSSTAWRRRSAPRSPSRAASGACSPRRRRRRRCRPGPSAGSSSSPRSSPRRSPARRRAGVAQPGGRAGRVAACGRARGRRVVAERGAGPGRGRDRAADGRRLHRPGALRARRLLGDRRRARRAGRRRPAITARRGRRRGAPRPADGPPGPHRPLRGPGRRGCRARARLGFSAAAGARS